MAITTTSNLGLKKVDDATTIPDAFDAENDNMALLDAAVGAVDATGDSLQEQVDALRKSVSLKRKTVNGATVSSISANGVSSQQTVATGVAADKIVSAYVSSNKVGVIPFNVFVNEANVSYNLYNRTGSAQSNTTPTVYVRYLA